MRPSPNTSRAGPKHPMLLEGGGDSGSERSETDTNEPNATRLEVEGDEAVWPWPRGSDKDPECKKSTASEKGPDQVTPKANKKDPGRAMFRKGRGKPGLSWSRAGGRKSEQIMPDENKLGPGHATLRADKLKPK